MNRSTFLKSIFTSITASTILPSLAQAELMDKLESSSLPDPDANGDEAYWEAIKQHFSLDKELYYFNNASLGPSPEIVIDATERFRRMMEGFPSRYMWGGWKEEKEEVRKKAAALLNVSPEEIALNHNTTEGMNIVASSMNLKAGDEVILGDHEHPSGTIPWKYWQESKGIKLVRPELPILPQSKEEVVSVYSKLITKKTKVISVCHLVNTNGMILPVKEISQMAHERGILVAVDGAQSAGMIKVDLKDLGCDYYAASTHKWLFSPKGMGIFYAKKASQERLKPLIVAHGYEDESIRRLENYNSRNLPELLGLGAALDFQRFVGTERKTERIYQLKRYFREQLSDSNKFKIKTPALDDLSAGITVVELKDKEVKSVAGALGEKYRVNCRPMSTHGLNAVRISLSIFNTKKDVDYLVKALNEIAVA
ncbi:MAG: aminotransferase class V-fold PLP-dependent enzyme [Bacteroidota bacterium]